MHLVHAGESADIVSRLRSEFATRWGRPAQVVARAPGRVNLMGEHTDYNGGLCLPIALPHSTYVAAAPRADGLVRVASRQQGETFEGLLAELGPGRGGGWATYATGVLWAMGRSGLDPPGLDLLVDSTVPVGAGLSSSAALEVSVALATASVLGAEDSPALRAHLVAACIRAETDVIGAPTGGMDQSIALFAVSGAALRLDFGRDDGDGGAVDRRPVHLGVDAAGLTLLVTDTGVAHALVSGGYGDRRRECSTAAGALGIASLSEADPVAVENLADPVLRRRVRHVVAESRRVDLLVDAIARDDWIIAGRLMSLSHASLRDDFEVSCAELDAAVRAATGAGALGSRMTGGGFGGSAVALVRTTDVGRVVGAIDDAFDRAGRRAPHHLVAPPAAAAEVIDL